MSRRQAREKAVQVLYQLDVREISLEDALQSVLERDEDEEEQEQQEQEQESPFQDVTFLERLVHGVQSHQMELDEKIRAHLRDWTLERLAFIDRAVLRIAAYEILYVDDIPTSVSLNEALELSRSFGMSESVKYINAVLDQLVKTEQSRVKKSDES